MAQIADIHEGKTVDGDPAALEGRLLEQQDEIEYLLGFAEFENKW